jgi:hypothetical protein
MSALLPFGVTAGQVRDSPIPAVLCIVYSAIVVGATNMADLDISGSWKIYQTNKYTVSLTAIQNGNKVDIISATYYRGSSQLNGSGKGSVVGNYVEFTIDWKLGQTADRQGQYTGSRDPNDGKLHGSTKDLGDQSSTANWESDRMFNVPMPMNSPQIGCELDATRSLNELRVYGSGFHPGEDVTIVIETMVAIVGQLATRNWSKTATQADVEGRIDVKLSILCSNGWSTHSVYAEGAISGKSNIPAGVVC